MKHAVIKKGEMGRWFDALKGKGKVFGPKKKKGAFVFGPIAEFEEMALFYIPTILPPKKYYFPSKEKLLHFSIDPFRAQAANGHLEEEMILFGVHTCDIAGIQCLDMVFSEKPADPYYLARKEHATLIGIECMDYCDKHASCAAVGTHVYKGGYDIMLTDIGDEYAMHINSEKGESLIQGKSYIREMNDEDELKWRRALAEKAKKFRNEFKEELKGVDAAFDKEFFSAVWEDVGRRCVGCTNCNSVCPTCYCFDVADELALSGAEGDRVRTWSYCQMDDFAKVATGEDFRPGRDARQRHRYYRKFQYSVKKYNKYFCTGCGRCTRTCMAKISLIETVNSLIDARRSA